VTSLLSHEQSVIDRAQLCRVTGRVVEVAGQTVVAEGLALPVGSVCRIHCRRDQAIAAQIVALRANRQILLTFHDPLGVSVGDRVVSEAGLQHVPVGRGMLGCVLNGMGDVIGGRPFFSVEGHYPIHRDPPPPLSRRPIDQALATGIRAFDGMLTVGGGQRLGIFAGTGVGKSVLLGMIARNTSADVIVVALIGERGREVGDFLRKDLGEEGAARAVVVVSTSDESPVMRVRAAFVATAVAEYFRDQDKRVLLLLDSTTRIAMAQREIGLAAGEPPTTKGYPPSVFSIMPKLLERSGRIERGSITGMYTVLVEGDDLNEPISDALRGILDGHVWLARKLANRGHYPAVDVLRSISRVMPDVTDARHLQAARNVRRVLAVWDDIEDLVNIGAYTAGTNAEFDTAVRMKPSIDAFLQQAVEDQSSWPKTLERLNELSEKIEKSGSESTARVQPAPAVT